MRTHALFYRCAGGGTRPPSASLPCALPCRSLEHCVLEWLSRALLVAGLILFSCVSVRAATYQTPVARYGFGTPRSYIISKWLATGEIKAEEPGIRNPYYLGNDTFHSFQEVFVFPLPMLGAGETIDSANFRFYTHRLSITPPFNVDLYAIAINNSGEPVTEFLETDTPDAGNIRLQDNLLTPLDSFAVNQVRNTDPSGDSALAAYLSSFYTDNPGYAGGSYVYLRLNPDGTDIGLHFLNLSGSFSGSVSDLTEPVLSFTTVPEPATYALAAIGAIGLLAFRRRKVSSSLN